MNRRLALTATGAVLAVLTAACGGSAATSPGAASPLVVASSAPSTTPVASVVAVATAPAPSDTPVPSTAPGASGVVPSVGIPNQDANLESLLPSAYQGAKLQKMSVKGSQYLTANGDMTKVVSQLGLTAADVSVAIAASQDQNAPRFAAIRFAGADSGKLQQVFQAQMVASGTPVTQVNVGGKDVLQSTDKNGEVTDFYVHNDVVLGSSGKDAATAAAGLALLP